MRIQKGITKEQARALAADLEAFRIEKLLPVLALAGLFNMSRMTIARVRSQTPVDKLTHERIRRVIGNGAKQ